MQFKLGGIVRRNFKAIIVVSVLSLPLMALFQNCGKVQGFAMTDIAPNVNKSSTVSTVDLPIGDTQIDQVTPGSSSVIVSTGDSSTVVDSSQNTTTTIDSSQDSMDNTIPPKVDDQVSIDLPKKEEQEEAEIEDAKEACALVESKSSESNNINGRGVLSEDKKSISGVHGKHILSSADFDGNTQISEISNSRGHLIICGLDVETLDNFSGKVILVNNTKIANVVSLNGQLVALDGSSANLSNSKAKISKR